VTVPSLDDWEKRWRKAEGGGPRTEDGGRENEMPRPGLANVVELAAVAA